MPELSNMSRFAIFEIEPYKNQKEVQQLIKISAGWYVLEKIKGELFFVDLRFGQMGFDINKSPFLKLQSTSTFTM